MPLVGLIALGMILYTLVAGIKLPGKIPGVFASVAVGTLLYYILGPSGIVGGTYAGPPPADLHFGLPLPTLEFVKGLTHALKYLPIAIPFGLSLIHISEPTR